MALSADAVAHRRDLEALSTTASNDLRVLLRRFNTAEAARDGLRDVLPRLVTVYGDAAVALAADWYEDLRDVAEARGRFTPVLADLPDRGRTNALAGWAVEPLFQKEPDFATTLVKVAGGLQRIIFDADRQTVMGSSVADPSAQGWQRVGSGECAFCEALIATGNVYSEDTADFGAHDHCQCAAIPAFGGEPVPVKPYTPSQKFRSDSARDAHNKRTRQWLRENT